MSKFGRSKIFEVAERLENAAFGWEMSQLVVDKVRDYLNTLLPSMELELFDVQFRKEGHGWVLRVFIDSETGVSLNNCSDVSRELGHFLDVEDPVDHKYHLEVSSPGLERPIRSIKELRRFADKTVKVKLHDAIGGQKVFIGIVDEINDDRIRLKLVDGESVEFSFEDINKARLVY